MPSDRFYCDNSLHQNTTIKMQGSEHHHLSRVMRVAVGEEVELVNGKGDLAQATLTHLDKHSALLQIQHSQFFQPPAPAISLAIPFMRPSKLELVIEKGTELGADAFYLYCADYSEKEELSASLIERLRLHAISALKQSGRLYIPSLNITPSLESLLHTSDLKLFGDTDPKAPFLAHITESILFITGPERGFSPKEHQLLRAHAQGVKLNPNILRAETAPLAAISIFKGNAHVTRINNE